MLAFGGGAALGGQGFDGEGLGTMLEFALRAQIIPLLGIGGTFSSLDAGNEFRGTLAGVNASLHLFPGALFVPYARIGLVNLFGVQGRLEHANNRNARGWGFEGVIGGNFTFSQFAVGPNIRIGEAAQGWTMIGAHLECRM